MLQDTIAAPATPLGHSALAVVRWSGPKAFDILSALSSQPLPKPRTAALRKMFNKKGELIDEGIAIAYPKPASFTGEDMVEFSCHGSPLILQKILKEITTRGARPAQRGEFSRRALLNGKLDLLQVEAIRDIIHADSSSGLAASQRTHQGELSKTMNKIREEILSIWRDLEGQIEFDHEAAEGRGKEGRKKSLKPIIETLSAWLERSEKHRPFLHGIRTVLYGPPNAGKSSLLNCLLKRDRALVSPFPGTTRDLLEEVWEFQGLTFLLTDAAGIHENPDPIEKMGIILAKQRLQEAQLGIFVLDGSQWIEDLKSWKSLLGKDSNQIIVINKNDIELDKRWKKWQEKEKEKYISISAKTGEGIDELKQEMLSLIQGKQESKFDSSELLLTNLRHQEGIRSAKDHLKKALENQLEEDAEAYHLRQGLESLESIVGATCHEELLDQIFSKFCIGK